MNVNLIIDMAAELEPADFGRLKAALITHLPHIAKDHGADKDILQMLWEVQQMRPSNVVSLQQRQPEPPGAA